MCGIAGVIDFRGRDIDPALLERWTRCLAHRGPDDSGTWSGSLGGATVGLAHTRLAIIDLSAAGHQPMWDGDVGIGFNGEIYNFQALRHELAAAGCAFRSNSDTEVILHAYRQWGTDCFDRFNGMWSLAIIDRANRTGLLARDRFGIKPLCYAADADRLIFASEMSAFAAPPAPFTDIDESALLTYLRLGYIPAPHTMLAGVQQLPPGCVLEFDDTGAGDPRPFYTLPSVEDDAIDSRDAASALRQRIDRAVADRLVADVPVGAFLSGGLDSSIIAAHMARHARGRVKTFSLGYENQPRYDETRFARIAAEHIGTDHTEIRVTFADVIAALPDMLDHIREPFADASLIPTAILSRHTRAAVTVALSGDGGDELFGGYWRYIGHAWLDRYRTIPAPLRNAIIEPLLAQMSAGKHSAISNRVRQMRKMLRAGSDADSLARHLAWSRILTADAEQQLLLAPVSRDLADVFRESLAARGAADRPIESLNDLLRLDLLVNLPGDMLHKVDLASMRHSLEVRVPLLDPAVVEFAAALPARLKVDGATGKRVLLDAYADWLPLEILARKKMGFELPIGEFLRRELRDLFHDVVDRRTVESLPLLRYAGVQQLFTEHDRRTAEHADVLYALLVLCWWRQRLG